MSEWMARYESGEAWGSLLDEYGRQRDELRDALSALGQRHDFISTLLGERERWYGPCFCHFGKEGDADHEPACEQARAALRHAEAPK